jgi:hypothetical protein
MKSRIAFCIACMHAILNNSLVLFFFFRFFGMHPEALPIFSFGKDTVLLDEEFFKIPISGHTQDSG